MNKRKRPVSETSKRFNRNTGVLIARKGESLEDVSRFTGLKVVEI